MAGRFPGVEPRRPELRERYWSAPAFVDEGFADEADAGINECRLECRDVGAGGDPWQVGRWPAHAAGPPLHCDHRELRALQIAEPALALNHLRQFAHRKSMYDGNWVLSDERLQRRIEHESGNFG